MYSQNNEDELIWEYFENRFGFGILLDIGANDGITLSNSRRLIDYGWSAHLVEPDPKPAIKLLELYRGISRVKIHVCAIGDENKIAPLFSSGSHLTKNDSGLLSSLSEDEIKRWKGSTDFAKVEVEVKTYKSFLEGTGKSELKFDFISIDAEGMDWHILKQIDLKDTSCLCIEWNSVENLKNLIVEYCTGFGLKLCEQNAENLIFFR